MFTNEMLRSDKTFGLKSETKIRLS